MSTPKETTTVLASTPARKGGRTWLWIVSGALIVLLGGAGGACLALLPPDGCIAQGVHALGRDLSGTSRAGATELIHAAVERLTGRKVTLTAGAGKMDVTLKELGVGLDADKLAASAYTVGRAGNLPARLQAAWQARYVGTATTLAYQYDTERLKQVVRDLAERVNVEPKDATGHWDDGAEKMVVTAETVGGALEMEKAQVVIRQQVFDALQRGAETPATLELPHSERLPHVTAAALERIDTVLGTYTTDFSSSTENRATNVQLATKALNGTALMPGDEFSFNGKVGPRTADAGFVTAPVIVNGQLEPGIGGGICQVSTTLYNAALLADMKITERSHHTLPIHYAPPGRDATVSYGALDLKFQNASDAAVLIEAHAGGRTLTIRLLGKGPAPKVTIELSDQYALPGKTVTTDDPTLPKGKRVVDAEGTPGVAVTVTRVVGAGADAKRELLSKDRYDGELRKVRVGTGPEAPTTTTPPTTPPVTTGTPSAPPVPPTPTPPPAPHPTRPPTAPAPAGGHTP
jgi:vancomycin resistance protein YoaR